MKGLKEYIVAFSGLKNGIHQFDYQIDKQFFEQFENEDILSANLEVNLQLEKQETMLIFRFQIDGSVEMTCDRCLEPCRLPINKTSQLFVKFGDSWEEVSDEIIVVPHATNSLDVSQYIYEFTILSLPIQRVHEAEDGENGCNREMLSYLNHRQEENQENQEIDPRWAVLRELNH